MARHAVIDAKTKVRIATADRHMLLRWREGVWLEKRAGQSVDTLLHRATADRLELAYRFRRAGRRLMDSPPPLYREAIGRHYYAMYHAMRAVVYFVTQGDDHEAHAELPSHTPNDFPSAATWTNDLKSARETRNRADYDAYPKSESSWEPAARQMQQKTDALLITVRRYLLAKGCKFI